MDWKDFEIRQCEKFVIIKNFLSHSETTKYKYINSLKALPVLGPRPTGITMMTTISVSMVSLVRWALKKAALSFAFSLLIKFANRGRVHFFAILPVLATLFCAPKCVLVLNVFKQIVFYKLSSVN